MSPQEEAVTRDRTGWTTLTAFCALVALTQVLWLSFAPVSGIAARLWDVDDSTVGDLTVVNPLAFVLLAWPAGRWLDRALPRALGVGAVLTAAGAVVRAFAPGSLAVVGTGQLLLSAGQPLVLGATTALAVHVLPPRRRSAGIAAASAAQLLGILAAAVTVPWLVDAHGLAVTLRVHAAVAIVVTVGLLASLRRAGAVRSHGGAAAATLPALARDPLVLALATCLFVGVGLFNALATWLEPMLAPRGAPSAGGSLALMTAAGIVGAGILAPWAVRRGWRRALMISAAAASCTGFAVVALEPRAAVVTATLGVVGLVLLSGLPVALEWAEEHVGAAAAGRTTSLLLWSGNLGGVLVTLAVQPLVPHGSLAFVGLALLALPAVVVASLLPRAPARGVAVGAA